MLQTRDGKSLWYFTTARLEVFSYNKGEWWFRQIIRLTEARCANFPLAKTCSFFKRWRLVSSLQNQRFSLFISIVFAIKLLYLYDCKNPNFFQKCLYELFKSFMEVIINSNFSSIYNERMWRRRGNFHCHYIKIWVCRAPHPALSW